MAKQYSQNEGYFSVPYFSEIPGGVVGTYQEHFDRTVDICDAELDNFIDCYFHRHKDDPDWPVYDFDFPLVLKALLDVLYGVVPESVSNSTEKVTYAEWISSDPEFLASAMLQALLRHVKSELDTDLNMKKDKLELIMKELNYGK